MSDDALAAVARLFEQHVRVRLTDGRTFVGRAYALDRERNLVLAEAYAFAPPEEDGAAATAATAAAAAAGAESEAASRAESWRFVGTVMVPGSKCAKVELAIARDA